MKNLYIIILSLISILTVSTLFHLAGGIISCLLYKIQINKVQLFYGKPLIDFNIKKLIFEIGWIPTGGSIHYDYEGDVLKRSKVTRIIINLSGPIAVIISATFILGPVGAFNELIVGVRQFFVGAISPFAVGEIYLSKLFSNVLPNSIFIAYGILACKISAINLLPIPPLNGGNILSELLISPNKLKKRIMIQNLGLLCILPFIILWGISIVSFLIKQI